MFGIEEAFPYGWLVLSGQAVVSVHETRTEAAVQASTLWRVAYWSFNWPEGELVPKA